MAKNVIISCAITGAIHTPSMSPYLPFTPDDIVEQAVAAAKAGAAILHLHARNPVDGSPSADPLDFQRIVPRILQRTDAVVNITSGGSTRMTLEERLAFPLQFKPEMASLNMGSMNFSVHPIARKITDWRFDWERPYIEGTEDIIFRNTFRDIKRILLQLGEGAGTRFEFECYDLGHLYNLAYFVDEGLVKPPIFIQSIFGILGGMGPDPENLCVIRTTADRLFGRGSYEWSILGAGRHQIPLLTIGAAMGANVRVGLEDNLYLGRGELARNNADQVIKMRRILNDLSLEPASPAEVRARLHLKGANNVAVLPAREEI